MINITTTAHRASLAAHTKNINIVSSSEQQCSHLCHNKKCVNPIHLIMESPANNDLRKCCNREQTCICNQTVRCIFPSTYLCIFCAKEVSDDDYALECDECRKWQHIYCQNIINRKMYMTLNKCRKNIHFPWTCDDCIQFNSGILYQGGGHYLWVGVVFFENRRVLKSP